MGIHSIKMPDIGEGIAEVELVAWHVKVGDRVAEDQILADVMTDKATVEIPSSVDGIVLALGGAVGQVMAVGSEVIRIQTADTPNLQAGTPESGETSRFTESPVAVAVVPDAVVALRPQINDPRPPDHERPIAAPAVRRRAWELGVDLQAVYGTGAAGRITHADLAVVASSQAAAASNIPTKAASATPNSAQAIPVIGLRRKIAQKMQEAKRRIPHFTYVEEVDVTELESLRTQLNAEHGSTRPRLTLLPFLIRALVLAVRDHPEVNARYDDEATVLTRFTALHLGLATQTDAGLMVPVIRHAEKLELWACAAEVLRLAEAARSGKASRNELTGSTLTLSSLGALGGIVSTPVINHPEVAIVGINRIVLRPVILDGAVVARKMMNLSSSFDHRVVDGLHAAEFIQRVRQLLQSPALLFSL